MRLLEEVLHELNSIDGLICTDNEEFIGYDEHFRLNLTDLIKKVEKITKSKLYTVTHILEDETTFIKLITFSLENAYEKVYNIKLRQGQTVMIFEFNLNHETGNYERGDMLLSWNQG